MTSNPHRSLYFLVPESVDPWVHVPLATQWQHANRVRPLLRAIPDEASVSATTYFVPHLSNRRAIIRIPFGLQYRNDADEVVWVDYMAADLWQFAQYAEFDQEREWLVASLQMIDQAIASQRYGVSQYADGAVLLQQATPSDPNALAAWQSYRRRVQRQLDELAS